MKVRVSLSVGPASVEFEAEAQSANEAAKELEANKDALASLLATVKTLVEGMGGGGGVDRSMKAEEEVIADSIETLQKSSQTDQALAVLYARFKVDPSSSVSPAELAALFSKFGFLKPANPSDLLVKAAGRGLVTLADGTERGRYRLTVPGRKRAEEILSGSK